MNIQQSIKKIKALQSELFIISECDDLKIVVHKPQFKTFSFPIIEYMGFSGTRPVYALMGQFERVGPYNSHIIAASESLELLVRGLAEFDNADLSAMDNDFSPLKF